VFVTISGDRIYVTLSRRNLRQLEAMLAHPDNTVGCLIRENPNGVCLVVAVENDAEHYEGREPASSVSPH
jgi:hypothetical protein